MGKCKLPEDGYWDFHNLENDFIEPSRDFILDFSTTRQPKIVKTISDETKCTVLIFRALKICIHLVTYPNRLGTLLRTYD
jgi:hypothetical protein